MTNDAATYVEDPTALGLPEPDEVFRASWRDFYRGVFLPDGFPGKLVDGKVIPHPIYGSYVVRHYLRRAKQTGDRAYVEGARRVAHAVLARMQPHHDGMVLWYEPSWGLSSWVSERHYSALTQSYYAECLARTARLTGDGEIDAAAHAAFRSLLVPKDDGGVLVRPRGGVGFEEVPTHPTSLVLNGWQSVVANLWTYADAMGDDDARDVAMQSTRTLADLLPLYDVPEVMNSRYSLAGYVHARVVFTTPSTRVEEVTLEVPDDGTWRLRPGEPGQDSRWSQFFFAQDRGEGHALTHRQLRMNLLLSRLSHPRPNVLRLRVGSPDAQEVRLQVRTGSYSPLSTNPVDLQWQDADSAHVPAGTSTVTLPLSWSLLPLVGYPTNFIKKIEGVHTNVYHRIHCNRLDELAEKAGLPELGEWARRWRGYTERWATSDVYAEVREANSQT